MKENLIWFEGSSTISCKIEKVKKSLINFEKYYTNVVKNMPGLMNVELIQHDKNSLKIKTNEGLMTRTNIKKKIEDNKIIMEFDEKYQAGKVVTSYTHYREEYTEKNSEIEFKLILSNIKTTGFLGFIYRKFASKNIGKASVNSYKTYLEKS